MKLTILKILVWLLFIGFFNLSSSQTYYEQFETLAQNKNSNKLQSSLDSLLVHAIDFETYTQMSHDFSVKFYFEDNYEAAIKYGLLEVNRFEKENIQNDKYLTALFQLGYFYELTSQFNEAATFYNKVISTAPNSVRAIQSYSKLGDCYVTLGNYFQAETYFLKAIAVSEKQDDLGILASQNLSLSMVYSIINTDDSRKKELEVLNRILEIDKIEPLDERRLSVLLNNLANYYNNKKTYDFNKAKFYYKELLSNAQLDADSEVVGMAYGNLGNLYINEKKDSALYYLNQSLKYPLPKLEKSLIYKNLTNYELAQGNKDRAITFLDKAIAINLPHDNINSDDPNLQDFKNAPDLIGIIDALSQKAKILLEKNEDLKNINLVESAFKNLQTADSIIDYIKFSNREENSRLYWRKEASKVYHNAVYCAIELNNKELAFKYSEKNKAILLTENIIENSVQLPTAVKSRKKFLVLKLSEYEKQLQTTTDSASRKSISNSIVNQKLAIKKHTDSVQQLYPSLTKKIDELEIISLTEIQNNLKSNEVLLSYVWNQNVEFKDHLMCIVVQSQKVRLIEIKNGTDLNEDINQYLKTVSQPFDTKSNKDAYALIAHRIYKKLFTDHQIDKEIDGKKITIVADGPLQNVPFEALITNVEKDSYFIENSQVNYSYSMSFSKNNRLIKRNSSENLISFAPAQFKNLALPDLYNSIEEVKAIHKHINGDMYTGSLATRSTFLNQIKNFKIIHLATHAKSGEEPYLAFYDQKLNIKQLYASTNNAQLVFLSACETSAGKIAQGEGTLTIARGFFNTGAQSVIASLWKTSDKSSSYIVEDFYKNVDQGNSVSTSLHHAKLSYIKNHKLSDSSPYYWASLIALGDDQQISIDSSYSPTLLIVAAMVILLLLLFLWYRKSSRTSS